MLLSERVPAPRIGGSCLLVWVVLQLLMDLSMLSLLLRRIGLLLKVILWQIIVRTMCLLLNLVGLSMMLLVRLMMCQASVIMIVRMLELLLMVLLLLPPSL
jgi:hypothetical protein